MEATHDRAQWLQPPCLAVETQKEVTVSRLRPSTLLDRKPINEDGHLVKQTIELHVRMFGSIEETNKAQLRGLRRRDIEDYIGRTARKIAARGDADPSSFENWRGPPKQAGEKVAAEEAGEKIAAKGADEKEARLGAGAQTILDVDRPSGKALLRPKALAAPSVHLHRPPEVIFHISFDLFRRSPSVTWAAHAQQKRI